MRKALILTLSCVLWLPLAAQALDRQALLDEANLLVLPRERALPQVALIDQDGQPFGTDALRGRWTLLFFGFTHCPDICPTTLADVRRLLSQLEPEVRDQLQVILVSADPARDTPAQLKQYLGFYRAGFLGLTGEMEQLQRFSRGLGLPFVATSETQGNYSVSHSGNLALVGPDATLRGHLRAPLKLEGLQRALPELIESADR
ncbi:SCO family protein [Stutzerimonas nosocomialis]|uniref:SCO family protein n=1 Tax=Stutzerimonas nosocomialis TaxID=1056496 RepID=A0A5R9QHI3_9GAMM|nr:SCO family protein [Stutzerimonas nosocomialis]TLX64699.1 SCO family protein [Stutzerimonas nosocomialis]